MVTVGVLASGNGSNLQAIMDACAGGTPPFRVGAVVSDNPDARALVRAREAGIPAAYLPPGSHRTFLDPEQEHAYISFLKEHGVELICLAGFMRVIKHEMMAAFKNRILNIHPSLLPSFPGLEAWKQALEYGVRYTGCTVHFVAEGVDTGPVILQAVVPVLPDDTAETLLQRIHREEHRIYPEAVRLVAENRIVLQGRSAVIR